MIAITVSTNYSDILPYVLQANSGFFNKWIMVTDANDAETLHILKSFPNIIILFWDFKNNGKEFDKGGAVAHAQQYAYHNFPNDWYLILDSDICLNYNFKRLLTQTLDPAVIYGVNRRDFHTLSDYQQGINSVPYRHRNQVHGYFQLYRQHRFYRSFKDASSCDLWFYQEFIKSDIANITCDHLGKSGHNWHGRTSNADFIINNI